jgi:hypothetical protein
MAVFFLFLLPFLVLLTPSCSTFSLSCMEGCMESQGVKMASLFTATVTHYLPSHTGAVCSYNCLIFLDSQPTMVALSGECWLGLTSASVGKDCFLPALESSSHTRSQSSCRHLVVSRLAAALACIDLVSSQNSQRCDRTRQRAKWSRCSWTLKNLTRCMDHHILPIQVDVASLDI